MDFFLSTIKLGNTKGANTWQFLTNAPQGGPVIVEVKQNGAEQDFSLPVPDQNNPTTSVKLQYMDLNGELQLELSDNRYWLTFGPGPDEKNPGVMLLPDFAGLEGSPMVLASWKSN